MWKININAVEDGYYYCYIYIFIIYIILYYIYIYISLILYDYVYYSTHKMSLFSRKRDATAWDYGFIVPWEPYKSLPVMSKHGVL